MPICRFWQQGNCRNGNDCKFEHAGPGGTQNQNRFNAFNAPSNSGRTFGDRYRPGGSNTRDDNTYGVTASAIETDLSKERPIWPLSSYGPGKDAPRQLFGGFPVEQSPEEMRMLAYAAVANGKPEAAMQDERALAEQVNGQIQKCLGDLNGAVKYVLDGRDAHPNRHDECVSGNTSGIGNQARSNAFSTVSSTPATFGQNTSTFGQPSAPTQTSAFGQPSAPAQNTAFGRPSALGSTPTFGQPSQPVSAFGQPSAPLGNSSALGGQSAFGQPSAPGFGQKSAFSQPSQPAFGQSGTSSTFGQPSQPGLTSAFGQVPQPGPTPAFGQPAFGQPSTLGQTQSQGSNSTFGQASQPGSTSTFGQPSQSGSTPAFGQPSQPGATSAFGQPSQPGAASAFGQPSQTAAAPAFGQPSAFGKPAFGTPSQPASFGGQLNTGGSAFGKPSQHAFGASPFGAGISGANQSPHVAQGNTPQTSAFGQSASNFDTAANRATSTQANANGFSTSPAQGSTIFPPSTVDSRTKNQNGLLSSFNGRPVSYQTWPPNTEGGSKRAQNSLPFYQPNGRDWERIWLTDIPQPNTAAEPQLPPSVDTGILTEAYKFAVENGKFKDDIMPEYPPKREWVNFNV